MSSTLDDKETQNSTSRTVKVVEISAGNKISRVTWKIENFPSLDTKVHRSEIFIVGGCKWQLLLYPKGNEVKYLSVYLNVPDATSLPNGWRRNADVCFCIINQATRKDTKREVCGNCMQFPHGGSGYVGGSGSSDTQKRVAKHVFDALASNWGFSSFVPLTDLSPKTGYMSKGTIIMEVEVSVCDVINYSTDSAKIETVPNSEIEGKESQNSTSQTIKVVEISADDNTSRVTWKIENFKSLDTKKRYSDTFIVGGCKWQLQICPAGDNVSNLSVYLNVADAASLPNGWSRYANFIICIINQIDGKGTKRKDSQNDIFDAQAIGWGFSSFIPLSDLCPKTGYMIEGTIIMEAEVSVRDVINYSTDITKPKTISKIEMEPQDRGIELDGNNAKMEDLKNKIESYEQELAMKDEEAKYKEMVIAKKDGEIAKKDGEIKELRASLELLEMRVEDMKAVAAGLRSHSYLSKFIPEGKSPTSKECSEEPIRSIGRVLKFLKEYQDPLRILASLVVVGSILFACFLAWKCSRILMKKTFNSPSLCAW